MTELHKPNVAILASGEGTTAEAFILAMVGGQVDVEVPLVIRNNRLAGISSKVTFLKRVHKLDIENLYISSKQYPTRLGEVVERGQTLWESERICEELGKRQIAHVALMGYMQVVTGDLLDEYGYLPEHKSIYQGRMSNTHPGPLPLTAGLYGVHASEKVLASRRKTSEHTVHLVAKDVDRGPIIARHRVLVKPGDSPAALFKRVQRVEKASLPLDIDWFLELQAGYEISQDEG